MQTQRMFNCAKFISSKHEMMFLACFFVVIVVITEVTSVISVDLAANTETLNIPASEEMLRLFNSAPQPPATIINLEEYSHQKIELNGGCLKGVSLIEDFSDTTRLSKYWINYYGNRPWKAINDPTFGKCATPDWSVGDETYIAQLYKGQSYDEYGTLAQFTNIEFDYYAYSPYPFCYGGIRMYVGNQRAEWKIVWQADSGGFSQGATAWTHVKLNLPTDQSQVVFQVYSAKIPNCQNYAPVYLDNINLLAQFAVPCVYG